MFAGHKMFRVAIAAATALICAPAFAQDPGARDASVSELLLRWEALARERFATLISAIPQVPEEFSRAFGVAARDINSGRPGLALGIFIVLILFGALAEWGARRLLADRSAPGSAPPGPTAPLHRSAISEIPPLLVFAIASIGLFIVFDWQPLLKKVVLTFLVAFIAFRIVRTATRMLMAGAELSPGHDGQPVAGQDDGGRQSYWVGRISLFAGILLFGWAFVSLMPPLQFSDGVRRIVAYLFGLGLLAVSIDMVWRAPRIVPVSTQRAALLSLYLIGLWMIWVAGMIGILWLGIYALLLPRLVTGVGQLSQSYIASFTGNGWKAALAKILVGRGARAIVIAAAIAWLVVVMRFNLVAASDESLAGRILYGAFNAIVVLLVADLVWALAKGYIEYRLAAAEQTSTLDADERARASRLRTLLPILRNGLGVLILTIAVLTVLAGLGVQIAPLIAGAGIFGVAIGFGSQTLVKDVLSGVFFMLDDAFRVGEYIQSGSYKGTVESFSLRSVRLRHHRGPIFTVPFGALGAVQNMSRDWVMEKWTISVTYDTDIDKARRIIKKIGAELAEDPEFAASTLQPLKMQGVDSFGEFAIILKLKLMTKPGEQFGIKRKAFVMIKKAFEENGIRIAVPTVEVAGSSDDAAVAQELTRRRKAAQAANTPE